MSTLGELVNAAIRSSGKTGKEIAEAIGVNEMTISRIRQGKEDNPKLQVLIGIARETGAPLAALLGASLQISPEDERQLQQFEGWIQEKLRTIDALGEPNAEILPAKGKLATRERKIADQLEFTTPLGVDAHMILRAIGDSMIADGILPDDTLYAVAHQPGEPMPVGKLVACRIGTEVFVKRLLFDKNRHYLSSAHPRYRPIEVERLTFEILGVIVGRSGRVR